MTSSQKSTALDLTKEFPRSPRETLGGWVIAARCVDRRGDFFSRGASISWPPGRGVILRENLDRSFGKYPGPFTVVARRWHPSGMRIVEGTGSGGVASLNHRLHDVIPLG